MSINVALDGPSGAGKSTIAKTVAENLGYVYVDTGAMYRAIGLYVLNSGKNADDEAEVASILNDISINLEYIDGTQKVMLNGEDVSDKIRTEKISMMASKVSAQKAVRDFLFDMQKKIAKEKNVIMDGRDIGTVVLPNADVKIFLTASAEERANRRYKELVEKGQDVTYDAVLKDIKERDYNDTNREIAPLKKADDAIEIDTTTFTFEESIKKIEDTIKENIKIEQKEKSNRFALPEVEPVDRTHKLSHIKMFFYGILRPIVRIIYHIVYNIKYEGLENVPKDGANIYASNHRSYADPVLLAIPTRVPLSYMAKEELFKQNIFFTALIKAFGAFPVVRGSGDTSVIDTSIDKLNKGRNLVIFPEGTRSKDGKVGKGKTGVALIAAMAQVPVIPVGIVFEGELKFRRKITVKFGKPILPSELKVSDTNPRKLKKIKSAIMDSITELVDYKC